MSKGANYPRPSWQAWLLASSAAMVYALDFDQAIETKLRTLPRLSIVSMSEEKQHEESAFVEKRFLRNIIGLRIPIGPLSAVGMYAQ